MGKRILKTGLLVIVLATIAVGISQAGPQSSLENSNNVYLPTINLSKGPLSIFGVQMYGSSDSGSKYHQALTDSGASWLRIQVEWRHVEPSNTNPKSYKWGSADRSLAAARLDKGDLNVIATIHHNPSWASPYDAGPINPGNLDDFAKFTGALVERFDGDGIDDAPGSPVVNYWELYNEPDAGGKWGNAGKEYAQMLQTVYPAMKAADPKAQVVFGGIAYDWFEDQGGVFVREFIDDVLTNCVGSCFDVMNFHGYPAFSHFWASQGPGLLEKTQAIRNKLKQHGYPNKPIIITEAAWHSNNNAAFPSNPEIQARYVVELFTQSLAADIKIMIWWMLYDLPTYFYDNGLISRDDPPEKKPSWNAYRTIVNKLGSAEFNRVLTSGETGANNMEAYKFIDDNKTIYVAWLNPIDTNAKKPLKLAGSQATVSDIYGAEQVILDGNDGRTDGRVTADWRPT